MLAKCAKIHCIYPKHSIARVYTFFSSLRNFSSFQGIFEHSISLLNCVQRFIPSAFGYPKLWLLLYSLIVQLIINFNKIYGFNRKEGSEFKTVIRNVLLHWSVRVESIENRYYKILANIQTVMKGCISFKML